VRQLERLGKQFNQAVHCDTVDQLLLVVRGHRLAVVEDLSEVHMVDQVERAAF
jgi:hypothetical protein